MIKIQVPNNYASERRYIFSVIFKEFFDLDIQIQLSNRKDVFISRDDEKKITITEKLFTTPEDKWLKHDSLPEQPLKIWNIEAIPLTVNTVNKKVPVIYGNNPDNPKFFSYSDSQIFLGLDIFGSAFFMMTRYEEAVKFDRDEHDRFPATASLAYQEGFLDRPIINEYIEILWGCMKYLWPEMKRKHRKFKIYVSHDVDEPFIFAFKSLSGLVKQGGGDIIKRHDPFRAVKNFSSWIKVKSVGIEGDPYNTFDLIMDISEQCNIKSAFYFVANSDKREFYTNYSIEHQVIKNLLHKIHQRGHEIGLHTSYHTYQDAVQTKIEFDLLKQVCAEYGIEQDRWGSRQHFLRWKTPATFQNLTEANLDYDTTLSFADIAGFRCGVCYEFPIFNVMTRQPLQLKERPLIVMECTILDERYMNLCVDDGRALEAIMKYKQRCKFFNGDFTLLWHNNRFTNKDEIDLYKAVLR